MRPSADRRRRFAPSSTARRRQSTISTRRSDRHRRPTRSTPPRVLILPNQFFGPYEALAARLKTAARRHRHSGLQRPHRVVRRPRRRILRRADPDHGALIAATRTRVTLVPPGAPLDADIWTDETGRMIRLSVPAQSLEVVRDDVAAVSSRRVVISRPNDEPVQIPSNGFSLAGTISKPARPRPASCRPWCSSAAADPTDRDGLAYGIPILGEIAGALADAGFLVVRYDKRGIGQSGGRAESASLTDYADDVSAAVKMLADRKDVDPKRIAVIGHSEGGSVALIAAAKDKRIAAVAVLATPGVTGAEVVLAQQKRLLDRSNAVGRGEAGEDRSAEAHSRGGDHAARAWTRCRRTCGARSTTRSSRACSSTDPAKMMPRRATAAADRAGRARHAGRAVERRPARGAGAQAQERAAGRGREDSGRQSSARAGDDRRGRRVRAADGHATSAPP